MRRYKRLYKKGGCYYFTVVTKNRKPFFKNKKNIILLSQTFQLIRRRHPFGIKAYVILPDHLHMIWQLPENDDKFSMRWRLIKSIFSLRYNKYRSHKEIIWQPRYWEHLIRDEEDFNNHVSYIHYNPIKHRYVKDYEHYPYSSYHEWKKRKEFNP